jgi:hypothetical protein
MQICMKATAIEISALRKQIAAARSACRRSDAEIGKIAQVHPSQVSRICRGEFKTISHNVVQICKAIGIEVASISLEVTEDAIAWRRLEASLRDLWDKDKTPEGADLIVRVLDTIGALRTH